MTAQQRAKSDQQQGTFDEVTPVVSGDLRAENERLKYLVIESTAATIKNVFYDSRGGANPSMRAEQVLTTAEACFSLARLPNTRPKLAEALETLGHELSAKAVEIDTNLQCRKERKMLV